MDQSAIGKYIYQKRKAKNLTQTQLAEKLGVSNKTISKWENGKCMPDYSIIENLCNTLGITISEFIDAEDAADDSIRMYDEKQITDLLRRTQELESQKSDHVRHVPYRNWYRHAADVPHCRRFRYERFYVRRSFRDFCR